MSSPMQLKELLSSYPQLLCCEVFSSQHFHTVHLSILKGALSEQQDSDEEKEHRPICD